MRDQQWRLFIVYSLNTRSKDPVCICPGKPLFFSSKEKAEDVIFRYKEYYPFLYEDSSESECIYCLILDEFELDSPYRNQLSTRVYSREGKLLSDCLTPDDGPFLGRLKKSIHHEIGEVVETPYGDQLMLGIVVKQPLCFNEEVEAYGLTASDDCYTVIHHQSQEINYAHAPLVFKPTQEVTDEIRENLLSAFMQITQKDNESDR